MYFICETTEKCSNESPEKRGEEVRQMTIPARWSLLSAAVMVVLCNLAWAVWTQTDVGWSLLCFVIVFIAVAFLAVGDYLDAARRQKD